MSDLDFSVKHVPVRTKTELQSALFTSQREDVDCIVEVESEIDTNVEFHKYVCFPEIHFLNDSSHYFFITH